MEDASPCLRILAGGSSSADGHAPALCGQQTEADRTKRAIEIIRAEINHSCQRPLSRGQSLSVGGNAEVNVRLKNILKLVVPVGGNVGVDAEKVVWSGTAMDQFARALESGNNCAVEIYKLFMNAGLVPVESAPRPAPAVAPAATSAFLAGFSAPTPDWWTGDASDTFGRVSRDIVNGRYAWALLFDQDVSSFPVGAPYPAAEAFEVAVDVSFFQGPRRSQSRDGHLYRRALDYSAGLIFGKSEGLEYLFRIGRSADGRPKYGLHRFDGNGFSPVLDWNYLAIDLQQVNRLSVTVAGGSARMYINRKLVDEFRLRDFKGGRVGLDATGTRGQWMDVQFDNFEFR